MTNRYEAKRTEEFFLNEEEFKFVNIKKRKQYH